MDPSECSDADCIEEEVEEDAPSQKPSVAFNNISISAGSVMGLSVIKVDVINNTGSDLDSLVADVLLFKDGQSVDRDVAVLIKRGEVLRNGETKTCTISVEFFSEFDSVTFVPQGVR